MNKTHEEILEYNIISSISGDGLPHEIVNALFKRKDSESLKDIPLAFIPGGSGNALAMNVLHISKENNLSIESIIYLICKGQKKKMDIIKFTTLEGENVYSLLSLSWGIWADVDLESEILRWLGEARFTAYAIIRLLKLRKYHAKLSFCFDVNEEKMPGIEEDISENENWTHIDGILKQKNC